MPRLHVSLSFLPRMLLMPWFGSACGAAAATFLVSLPNHQQQQSPIRTTAPCFLFAPKHQSGQPFPIKISHRRFCRKAKGQESDENLSSTLQLPKRVEDWSGQHVQNWLVLRGYGQYVDGFIAAAADHHGEVDGDRLVYLGTPDQLDHIEWHLGLLGVDCPVDQSTLAQAIEWLVAEGDVYGDGGYDDAYSSTNDDDDDDDGITMTPLDCTTTHIASTAGANDPAAAPPLDYQI